LAATLAASTFVCVVTVFLRIPLTSPSDFDN